ncbi:uncharacterized protein TNCV_4388001 [Trichonephila clavipes]|nr:uncharacterized protein TNCV_4388001 [Trichonephila clavipes]
MEYNAPKSENSIDNLCYTQFIRSTKLNKSVQLSNLPPTSAAAHQHISRVYYQVQTCSAYPGPSRPLGARPKRPIDKTALASRGLWATDHVILNHGQVTWTTPELAPPLLTTTPHQREDVSALDRFKVHRCPTRWVFSGTGLELMTSCHVIYSQFGLAIHQNDHQARRRFVEWAQNEIAVVPYFHKRILFSDEAHFSLNGYVNKQNCRIWSEANPQVYVETPLHPEKLTVWCALCAGGIIGPYFFKNDEGHNVTVNGDRYRAMITNFFVPELNNHDVQELWFQQDGATCHTARATIDLLKDTLGDRLISRFGPVNWPPRSCDLTPLDYFLWGYVKSLVYATNA